MIHREDSIPIDSQLVRYVQKETFWMTNSLFNELVLFIKLLLYHQTIPTLWSTRWLEKKTTHER